MADAKPRIACLPNGPYYLLHSQTPAPVPNLCREGGDACATIRGVALCRCGGSKNKPFCDGTHGAIGFSDRNKGGAVPNRRTSYAGRRITVHDNRAICAHAGHCTGSLSAVFRMGQEPWIDPDAAAVDAIVAAITQCPSGALSYSIEGELQAAPTAEPLVTVTNDGPYAVAGDLELLGVKFGEGASSERYTLCRCGASRNKPFCDGSHWRIGFRDAAP